MQIKSKLNGETSHVRPDIARELVKMGVAEIVRLPRPGDAPKPVPAWAIVDYHGFLAIEMRLGTVGGKHTGRVQYYLGSPDSVNNRKDHAGNTFCTAFGWHVPDDVVDKYKRACKQQPARVYDVRTQGGFLKSSSCSAGTYDPMTGQFSSIDAVHPREPHGGGHQL